MHLLYADSVEGAMENRKKLGVGHNLAGNHAADFNGSAIDELKNFGAMSNVVFKDENLHTSKF